MYVCLCHGLNDKAIAGLKHQGAKSSGCVFRKLGVRPQCGKCASHIRSVLRDCDCDSPTPTSDTPTLMMA